MAIFSDDNIILYPNATATRNIYARFNGENITWMKGLHITLYHIGLFMNF